MKKVLLVRANIEIAREVQHPINYRPPYTLKYIQALLKRDKAFTQLFIDAYVNTWSLDSLFGATFSFNPDFLIISSTPLDIISVKNYISRIKQKLPKTITMVIGPGPSALPGIYQQEAQLDFVLPGEAEIEAYSILQKINQGENLAGLRKYYREDGRCNSFIVEELEKLPFAEYSKEEIERYSMIYPLKVNRRSRWGHILSSRGCPYSCIFCSPLMRDSYGQQLRLRSAKNVIDEVQHQLSCGASMISFDDDNFTTSRKHVFSICSEILKRRMDFPWIVHARVDNLDRELMQTMKQAGCCLLRIGVESGSARIVKLLKKTDRRDWLRQTKKTFNTARELRIQTAALFIIGNPTETRAEILQSIELAKNLDPDLIQVCFFTPFPGSSVYAENQYSYDAQNLQKIHQYSPDRVFNLSNLKNQELVDMHRKFYRAFLFNPRFIFRHMFKYFWFYLINPAIFLRLLRIKEVVRK